MCGEKLTGKTTGNAIGKSSQALSSTDRKMWSRQNKEKMDCYLKTKWAKPFKEDDDDNDEIRDYTFVSVSYLNFKMKLILFNALRY
jgi:hypothetical protein